MQVQEPSGWQSLLPAPQASPCCAGSITHVPGVAVPSSQVKQAGQVGSHWQGPHSTMTPQLLGTAPHWPAHVWARESGVQVGWFGFFLCLFFRL